MAMDFPSNPTDGQVYQSYIYSASSGVWKAREESASPAVISSVPPPNPSPGDIWVDSSDGVSYIRYDDGTSSQWIEMISSGVTSLALKADKTYVDSQDALKANLSGANFTGGISAASSITATTPSDGGSAGGIVIRTPAAGSQTSAYLQFVNNANTVQYGTISVDPNSKMNISVPVTMPQQPVYGGSLQFISTTTSNFYPVATDTFNVGFSRSGNNRLTVQTAGKYYVVAQQLINTSGTGCYFQIQKNGATVNYAYSNSDDTYDVVVSALINCAVNDYIEIYYSGSVTYGWSDAHSRYSVFKVS